MESLDELLDFSEDVDFEVKKAQGRDGKGEVPHSLWETYSAMANTNGGIILLGVQDDGAGRIKVIGLQEPEKLRKALWDNLNNRLQVSANLLQDSDIQVVNFSEKQLLRMHVPRASRRQRPIYVGTNPFTGTYRRSFEGDYHCDEATVRRMLAEAMEEPRDASIQVNFTLEDIDQESWAAYRNEFRSTKPGHPWVVLDDRELLRNLGGWAHERQTRQEGLTLAGLLMFGRLRSILDAVPHYLVDYQERLADAGGARWIDRITTDGTWSGNLFDFYRRVYPKLASELKVPFRLEQGFKRIDESHVHEALREALVNALIHADYSGSIGILIIKYTDGFVFRNPGGLRLPLNVVLSGGVSDCRNRNLQKMFQMVGASEQAGSGIPKILRAWREQHWRVPIVVEGHQIERTFVRLSMVSLLPQETLEELDKLFGEKFRALNEIERLTVATACSEGEVTNARLREMTTMHPRDLTTMLHALVDHGFLIRGGTGRWTYYYLTGREDHRRLWSLDDLFVDLEDSEQIPARSEQRDLDSEQIPARSEQRDLDSEQIELYMAVVASVRENRKAPSETVEEAIRYLCHKKFVTLKELAESLSRTPDTLRVHYLSKMLRSGQLTLKYPDKPNHPDQAYMAQE